MSTGLLAQAEADVKGMVKGCTCGFGYRVRGLEYDTGGCMPYSNALAIARKATEMGGSDAWAAAYAICLDGTPKRSRRR